MKCYFHGEIDAVIQCKGCDKHLCHECHDPEVNNYCYVCALEVRNEMESSRGNTQEVARTNTFKDWGQLAKIIAWYEILGGIIGVFSTLFIGITSGAFQDIKLVGMLLIFFTLFSISILSGVLLLRKNQLGYTLSIFIQLFQIPQFIIGGTIFSFISGLQMAAQLMVGSGVGFKLAYFLGSTFNLYINTNVEGFMISINGIPIMIIYLLFRAKKQRSANQRTSQPTHDSA